MTDEPHSHPDKSNGNRHIPLFVRFIATGFYSGYIPWASGTFGSLVGALFFLIPGFSNPVVLLASIVVGLAAGVYTSARVAGAEGGRLTKSAQRAKELFQPERHDTPDPSIVVIDEIVGMWVSMLAISPSIVAIVIAFFVFRVFDIVKPYPARQLERYHFGMGIMLDDVVAGIYANIVTRILLAAVFYFFPTLL
jgi:phosphatidylglycerophosphatase A